MSMRFAVISVFSILVLSGCAGEYNAKAKFKEAQYWQRVHASEAAYTRGPKAQQMLNRDIARCVTELRELVRLGTLPASVQHDFSPKLKDPDMSNLEAWDTPEYHGYLRREHSNYHDFESCMRDKGWERTMYVPYDMATESRDVYLDSLKHLEKEKPDEDDKTITVRDRAYSGLNE